MLAAETLLSLAPLPAKGGAAMTNATTEFSQKSTAADPMVNVGVEERWLSILGGGLLTAYGLGRRSIAGLALAATGGALLYRGTTGHCPAYASLGIDTAERSDQISPIRIVEAVTVSRPREELYQFWQEVENLPRFMRHLESVRKLDGNVSVWQASAPRNLGTVTWEAELTENRPGELIAWRSLPGADIETAGRVQFADASGARGTVVRVDLSYQPPGGILGAAAASLLNPAFSQLVREDVRRFKSLMEAGEIPTVEGQPKGL